MEKADLNPDQAPIARRAVARGPITPAKAEVNDLLAYVTVIFWIVIVSSRPMNVHPGQSSGSRRHGCELAASLIDRGEIDNAIKEYRQLVDQLRSRSSATRTIPDPRPAGRVVDYRETTSGR